MYSERLRILLCLMAIGTIIAAATSAHAAYVIPMRGGGQVGGMVAPMIHADITFDGTNIGVVLDQSYGIPLLRPLTPPDAFDPNKPWSVLIGQDYNFQYAWNPGGLITLPAGAGIWVERLHYDENLHTYLRPAKGDTSDPNLGPPWPEIFTSDGYRFKWGGTMHHNAYTVLNPTESVYTADYRVYIGDGITGAPLAGYGSADVTLTWNATPVPEPLSLGLLSTGGALALTRYRCRRFRR
jgi:hypothetical protein